MLPLNRVFTHVYIFYREHELDGRPCVEDVSESLYQQMEDPVELDVEDYVVYTEEALDLSDTAELCALCPCTACVYGVYGWLH